MKYLILFHLILLVVPSMLSAQTKAVTENGDTVILHADHTWEITQSALGGFSEACSYVEVVDDSLLGRVERLKYQPQYLWGDKLRLLEVELQKYDDLLYANFLVNNYYSLCIDERSTISVTLANGDIVTLPHEGEKNCGKKTSIVVAINPKVNGRLQADIMTKVRLVRDNGWSDFPVDRQGFFMKYLPCF